MTKSDELRVKSKDGRVLNVGAMMERWKKYFQELLCVKSKPSEEGAEERGTGFTLEEIKETVRRIKNGKAH